MNIMQMMQNVQKMQKRLTDAQKELFAIKETTDSNSNFVPNNELHKMPSAVIREPAPVITAVKNNDGSYSTYHKITEMVTRRCKYCYHEYERKETREEKLG